MNLLRISTQKIDKVSAIVYTIDINKRVVKIAQLANNKVHLLNGWIRLIKIQK